jgi:hypothetical protein
MNVEGRLFIPVPKTGCSTIVRHHNIKHWGAISKELMIPHPRCKDIIEIAGPEWFEKLNAFSIVRNPFDRMVSWYTYSKQRQRNANFRIYQQFTTFEEWILAGAPTQWETEEYYNDRIVTSQRSWLTYDGDPCGDLAIPESSIFRFETFQFEGHENASRTRRYQDYYNDQTIELVTNMVKGDLEFFGYKYDE